MYERERERDRRVRVECNRDINAGQMQPTPKVPTAALRSVSEVWCGQAEATVHQTHPEEGN
ncbi:hypothetical protein E2C01_077238 [Portunus trituberculatus]|uniref:Uncharacterized protein n=1 Tax=Portunus trituberculatus TaxID=210409 RepID=A0A5B7IJR0_PORTR|nr:hypothetical protein [Portunus trituberculatus]